MEKGKGRELPKLLHCRVKKERGWGKRKENGTAISPIIAKATITLKAYSNYTEYSYLTCKWSESNLQGNFRSKNITV